MLSKALLPFIIICVFSGCGTILSGTKQNAIILSDSHNIVTNSRITGYYAKAGSDVSSKDADVKRQAKESGPVGDFIPINVDQERVIKSPKSIELIVTDRSGKRFTGYSYGLQDDVLLLCSLSWSEKPIGIRINEISKIEIERKSDALGGCIDGTLIVHSFAAVLFLLFSQYDEDFSAGMILAPLCGGCYGGPIGSLIGALKGINQKIDLSKLSETDKANTVKTLLGIDKD